MKLTSELKEIKGVGDKIDKKFKAHDENNE
jgi:hypothetical protein